jgi:pimeloyl-ACP methyl ester carboxylesterase
MSRAQRAPLVLIPGLLCDSLLWAPQVAGLGEIADCWIADITRADTISAIATEVLRESPFEQFSLAGLSMGGYVAMEIMRQAPSRVTRLALLDTTPTADTPEQIERRKAFIDLADRGRFMGVTDQLLPILIHADRLTDLALVATVKSMARNVGKDAFIRQQRAIMGRVDSRPSLASIACPTLVACGREDKLTPLARSEEMASAVPGARLVVIEQSGHLSTLEQPQAVNVALREWLATT